MIILAKKHGNAAIFGSIVLNFGRRLRFEGKTYVLVEIFACAIPGMVLVELKPHGKG